MGSRGPWAQVSAALPVSPGKKQAKSGIQGQSREPERGPDSPGPKGGYKESMPAFHTHALQTTFACRLPPSLGFKSQL